MQLPEMIKGRESPGRKNYRNSEYMVKLKR